MPQADSPWGTVVITGSGDSFNLQALQSDIGELFSEHPGESINEFEKRLSDLLASFYDRHVAITSDMTQRPEVELIVAARRGTFTGMWMTNRNRVSRAGGYVAVGVGGAHARSVFSSFALPQDSDTAMVLAAYIVFLVKQRNLWVGMDTQVLRIDEGPQSIFPKGFGVKACRELEEMFRACAGIQARVLHRILGSEYDFCEEGRIAQDIEFLRKEFLERLHPKSTSTSESSQA